MSAPPSYLSEFQDACGHPGESDRFTRWLVTRGSRPPGGSSPGSSWHDPMGASGLWSGYADQEGWVGSTARGTVIDEPRIHVGKHGRGDFVGTRVGLKCNFQAACAKGGNVPAGRSDRDARVPFAVHNEDR